MSPAYPEPLKAPFPWFGGKSKIAEQVWEKFGNPTNYIEPFAGSLAVLLKRPLEHEWWNKNETVNDLDGNISNWHRAVTADPEQVAYYASQPVNEVDLTAKHLWLIQNAVSERNKLLSDPTYYNPKTAGWWIWGISAWVGGEWCTGMGPFTGNQPRLDQDGTKNPGVYRKIPMISGSHSGKGIHKPIKFSLQTKNQPDINQIYLDSLTETFTELSNRLRRVRVACGDWTRVLGNAAIPPNNKQTAVFLDPPYDLKQRRANLYAIEDQALKFAGKEDESIHIKTRTWALEKTGNPQYKIAYCSYSNSEENKIFQEAGWEPLKWAAKGGYALSADNTTNNRAKTNKDLEIIWFSPDQNLEPKNIETLL